MEVSAGRDVEVTTSCHFVFWWVLFARNEKRTEKYSSRTSFIKPCSRSSFPCNSGRVARNPMLAELPCAYVCVLACLNQQ